MIVQPSVTTAGQADVVGGLPAAEALHAILKAGIAAPSAENRHFVRFDVSDDRVRIVSTDTHTWNATPHRRMLDLMACGAMVENMRLQASTFGLTQRTSWFADVSQPDAMADCRWTRAAAQADELAAAIADRHTNRHFYARRHIIPAALDKMSQAASVIPSARVRWLAGEDRKTALHAIRIAETERFRRQALHDELFSAVRFDAKWNQGVPEGLPPGALGIELPMRAPFAGLRHWPLMHALSKLGVHALLGLRAAYLPSALAPALGLVEVSEKDSAMAAVLAGCALERTWLAATSEHLAFQPMAASTVLLRQRTDGGWVSAPTQQEIRRALDRITGDQADTAFMFFRVGHAAPPKVRAGRPAFDKFL